MSTAFQQKVGTIAQQQYNKHHLLRENQDPLSSQIKTDWEEIGLTFPGVDTAWSAVIVSWCVKKAGASAAQFKFASAHSQFMFQAIANYTTDAGVFRGRKLSTYTPKVGDIIQNNRPGNSFDFAFAKTHKSYVSHSALVIEVGSDTKGAYLRTIGGNASDSVGLKEVRLSAAGKVINTQSCSLLLSKRFSRKA